MKVSVVRTRLIRTISVSTYKELEWVMSPWPCLPSAPCHLGHGGEGEDMVGGKRILSAGLFRKKSSRSCRVISVRGNGNWIN